MTDIIWTHPSLPTILNAIPTDAASLVDLGCGRGIMGALSRIYRDVKRLVGVDAYQASVDFCKRHNFYDEYLIWDLNKMPLPFKDKEFRVSTCIEVIEHLSKESGARLIDEMERVARHIIITTPNLFFEQPEYDNNPNQRHISRWTVRDFRRRGYKVYGVGEMKIFGHVVTGISHALGSLTKYTPALSSLLLCVKDTKKG